MSDYICPECGHRPHLHKDGICMKMNCECEVDNVYIKIIEIRDQALAEAREALRKCKLVVTNHESGHMREFQEAERLTAEWLKKWSEK